MTEMITEPGIYEVPIEFYHSDCCDGVSISNSGLSTIANKSLAHYWVTSYYNTECEPQDYVPHFSIGSAAHSLILEGHLPTRTYLVSPHDEFRTKEAKAWKAEAIKNGKIIVKKSDLKLIADMAESMSRHPLIRDGILNGDIEKSMFWKHGNGWLKNRPDCIPEATILADLKVVARADFRAVNNAVADYGYHMQAALGVDGMLATMDVKIKDYVIIAVEKSPPYSVTAYPIDMSYIDIGRKQYLNALSKFHEAWERNEWPGFPDATLYAPKWLRQRVEYLDAEGQAA